MNKMATITLAGITRGPFPVVEGKPATPETMAQQAVETYRAAGWEIDTYYTTVPAGHWTQKTDATDYEFRPGNGDYFFTGYRAADGKTDILQWHIYHDMRVTTEFKQQSY